MADKASLDRAQKAAFEDDPMVQWHWPTPKQRQEGMAGLFDVFVHHSIQHSCAYCTHDFAGLALWHPPDSPPDESGLIEIFRQTTSTQLFDELGHVFEQLEAFRPKEPHWYLSILAVEPSHQGKGYGSALMRHALERCDESRLPAYLVSPNLRNLSLYQRHGFEIVGTAQSRSSPVVTAMFRPEH
jgi:GNAT superfamily N-acetyltransferase